MTDDELTEIEERCQRPTAGPWESFIEARDHLSSENFIRTDSKDLYLFGATPSDLDFIAAAREDVPALIAEIRKLRHQLGRNCR
jgi:hypothetical protein